MYDSLNPIPTLQVPKACRPVREQAMLSMLAADTALPVLSYLIADVTQTPQCRRSHVDEAGMPS